MKNRKTILIGGDLFGYHNIGDEAILESDILAFQDIVDIMVFTKDDSWLKEEYPNVQTVLTKDIIEAPFTIRGILGNIRKACTLWKYYNNADVFFFGGGTAMSDFPWHCLGQVNMASIFKVPSVIWGAGYAKVDNRKTEKFISKVLNKSRVKSIYVRDEKVQKRLCDIGVMQEKIDYCYDPVIKLEGESFEQSQYLTGHQQNIFKNGRKNVVITLSGEKEAQEKMDIKVLVELANRLSEIYNLWLIPTGFLEGCDDVRFLYEIKERVGNVNLLEKEFRPKHLIEFLKKCDVVITSRLHMSIFAACAGTPFIALERSEKNSDFSNIMGLKCFSMLNLNVEVVLNEVNSIVNKQQEYRKHVLDRRDCLREHNELAIEKMKEIIKNI